jgi:hypothetical protein
LLHAFVWTFRWFIFPKPVITSDDIYLLGVELAWGETICFKDLEFIADRLDN